jgi:hypothetical protein
LIGNRDNCTRHHPSEVDGVGLQCRDVEVAAVETGTAVKLCTHLTHHGTQRPAAAVVALGRARRTACDGMGQLVGEVVEGVVLVQVADAVGALRRAGVDEGAADALLQLLLQVAAVDGVVDDGAGGVVEQVFLQLLGEGGFGVDFLHARCGVQPLQHACGHHRGDQRFDVLALTQVVERLAEIAFVVERDDGLALIGVVWYRLMRQPRQRIGLGGLREGEAVNEEEGDGAARNQFAFSALGLDFCPGQSVLKINVYPSPIVPGKFNSERSRHWGNLA